MLLFSKGGDSLAHFTCVPALHDLHTRQRKEGKAGPVHAPLSSGNQAIPKSSV